MATPTGKAWAFVIRGGPTGPEVLLFAHPDGSVQVPKGTIDPGESPGAAVVRELREETGLVGRIVETLPLMDAGPEWPEPQLWHPFVLAVDGELPDAWEHVAEGSSEEAGEVFRCHFAPLFEAPARVHPLQRAVTELAAASGTGNAMLWDAKSAEWDAHVGDDGDANRRLCSDPVLWRFLGDVAGQRVLDAGCGTGYLSARLLAAGATVDAVDVSARMVERARSRAPGASVRVDDLQELSTCANGSYDAVVSNYVLMDLPDLRAATTQVARVLAPGGRLVAVFSHPLQGLDQGYFERGLRRERWGPFSTVFQFWHRPLRDYLQALLDAGLALDAFEEPIADPGADLDPETLARFRRTPWSVALRCRRTA